MTRPAALDSLRSAFGELIAADRRLKARDPQQPDDLSLGQVRALFKVQEATRRSPPACWPSAPI